MDFTKHLADKTIVLGITGSIAAVRTIELAHELIRRGATVQAVMTEPAERIIHPDAIECATGRAAITGWTGKVSWVEYCGGGDREGDGADDGNCSGGDARSADLLLIAPCTASTIGKIAHGIPDTLVSIFATTAIGAGVPVIVSPAMHESMYNPIVRGNIEILRDQGVTIVGPIIEEGKAKIAPNDDIVRWAERALDGYALSGTRILITGGATAEPIDPARIITSRASGRMGASLAYEAFRRGADVTLVHSGRIGFSGIREIYVETAEEMTCAVLDELGSGEGGGADGGYDLLISAAAISDYTLDPAADKIRSDSQLTLDLRPTRKLLEAVRDAYPDLAVVGFKLETATGDVLIERAKAAMDRYGLSMVVANTVKSMGGDAGDVRIISKKRGISQVSGAKEVIAGAIFDSVEQVVGLAGGR
ncbi:MAG: bifunctional phosphopantothenoylcysteine decarboxylase/phosphopantothenate--cysteine ligase CoaBC [Candidatus Methanogaster sp.]|uniref:Bifunctional phosphopantothenoylcysteine decarboxylase/phosphopantothenate--cysteine ligase CoaBC n=1 Tax=Candidatus Methanogaster sp. TaxID=3386292 RepID=A0AC61KY77_9EURY|nr:MAG: bifunctional phosphopantothenoylcysteine decarboxylase/phosphopantothenate--cysteine ligase CoaBC [ANME-2 cluster archaeon]